MTMNSIAVATWLCVALFLVAGMLTVLDTAGLYKIPYPSRSKALFAILLAGVTAAAIVTVKHTLANGALPAVRNAQPSLVALLNIRAFPISARQNLEFIHPQGKLTLFCRDIKTAQQKADFIVRGLRNGDNAFELPMHGSHTISLDGARYRVTLDGIVNWREGGDQAFISITSEST